MDFLLGLWIGGALMEILLIYNFKEFSMMSCIEAICAALLWPIVAILMLLTVFSIEK